MITALVRRGMPIVGIGVLFVLVARSADLRLLGDMWFHLRLGDEFLAGWSITRPGHLGMFDSADWVPTQWLSQMGMSSVEHSFGLDGVLWLAALAQITLVAVVYFTSRSVAGPLPAAVATALALTSIAPGLSARPQVLSYLFLALIVWSWLATARSGRPPYGVVVLSWLWVPLHGMWPIGLVVSAVMAAAVLLERRPARRDALKILVVPVLSSLVTVATPLGWHAISGVVTVGERRQYFTEWRPPVFTDPDTLGVSVMTALVLLHLLRRTPTPWSTIALLGLAIASALLSMRTMPIAAILIAPLFAQAVQVVVPQVGPPRRPEVLAVVGMALGVLLVLALSMAQRAERQVAPEWLDTYLDAAPDGTRVLSDWDSGAYFLWRHPQLDLTMHGYADVFTDAELARNSSIIELQPGWDDRIEDLNAEVALLPPHSSLAYALTEHAGWTRLEGDDLFVVLTPPAQ